MLLLWPCQYRWLCHWDVLPKVTLESGSHWIVKRILNVLHFINRIHLLLCLGIFCICFQFRFIYPYNENRGKPANLTFLQINFQNPPAPTKKIEEGGSVVCLLPSWLGFHFFSLSLLFLVSRRDWLQILLPLCRQHHPSGQEVLGQVAKTCYHCGYMCRDMVSKHKITRPSEMEISP